MSDVAHFEAQFKANQTAEWVEKYCDYSELMRLIKENLSYEKAQTKKDQLRYSLPHSNSLIFDAVQVELDRVNEFYQMKQLEYQKRYENIAKLAGKCRISPIRSLDMTVSQADISFEMSNLDPEVPLELDKKTRKLVERALEQIYRGLMMLHNFALLNNSAFMNLLSEFQKLVSHEMHACLQEKLSDLPFSRATETEGLQARVVSLYAAGFTKGDTKKAQEVLQERKHDYKAAHNYLIGFFVGTCVPLLILWIIAGVVTRSEIGTEFTTQFLALIPVYRLVWVPILGLWMYGLDLLVWHQARINYTYIFEYDPKTVLSYSSVFLGASLCFSIFCTFLFIGYNYLVDIIFFPFISQQVGLWLWPTLMLMMISFLVFWPFRGFWRASRWCFTTTSISVWISPLGPVGFREFFVGDVYTSLVKTLCDLEYTICYYVTGSFLAETNQTCGTSSEIYTVMLPIISVAPLYWRVMQCWKRYYLTREKVHLVNSTKYMAGLSVVLFSTLMGNFQQYEPDYWPPARILWLISFICSTLYMYCWDLWMDWGLGRIKSKHFFLRDDLVWVNHKWFYWYCIVSNFVFRFFWTITITPFAVDVGMQTEMLNLIAASIEIIRRFTWAIIRVENEHLNNCDKFRVIDFVPLPFDVNKTEELEVAVDGSVVVPTPGATAPYVIPAMINREEDDIYHNLSSSMPVPVISNRMGQSHFLSGTSPNVYSTSIQ